MIAVLEQHREEIADLCRRFGVRRLEVFGSASTGAFREGESDFDFLVEFEDQGWKGSFDRYFGVKEGLEELFGASVDLVMDRAIENPYFRASVDASRAVLYGTSPRAEPSAGAAPVPHRAQAILFDVDRAAGLIAEFVADRDAGALERDPLLRSAVERQVGTLRDGLTKLRRLDARLTSQITDASAIIAHVCDSDDGYAGIGPGIVETVIRSDLGRLRAEVAALLAEA